MHGITSCTSSQNWKVFCVTKVNIINLNPLESKCGLCYSTNYPEYINSYHKMRRSQENGVWVSADVLSNTWTDGPSEQKN